MLSSFKLIRTGFFFSLSLSIFFCTLGCEYITSKEDTVSKRSEKKTTEMIQKPKRKVAEYFDALKLPAASDRNAVAWLKKNKIEFDTDSEKRVVKVDFSEKPITENMLKIARQLGTVRMLYLDDTNLKDEQIAKLAEIKTLTDLSVQDNEITDRGMVYFAKMKNLESLYLAHTKISGKGLVHIAKLSHLKRLNLSDCNITDDDLKYLSNLVNVETMALANTKIKGHGLELLKNMQNLITLTLNGLDLKGDTIESLAVLDKLRIVNLKDSNTSKKSIARLKDQAEFLAVFTDD